MIAWVARLFLMLAVCLAVAVAIASRSHWGWLFGLAIPGALLAGLAVVLAFEFAFAAAAEPTRRVPPLALRLRLTAWWAELGATTCVVVWRVPFRSGAWPPIGSNALGRRGMVLVHGYGCNRGIWRAWLDQLKQRDVPCSAINLEPIFASISDYAPLIEQAVARMQMQTGLSPVVVGHSMGGLAIRNWWAKDRTASRLHRLITIATPHQGTVMAKFGRGEAALQMRPQPDWLARLQAAETPEHARRTVCFYSACDNVVIPASAATLPGADNRELSGHAHVALVDHPHCFAEALRCIQNSG